MMIKFEITQPILTDKDSIMMLTTVQLAERLGKSPSTIGGWRFKRSGPPYVILSGKRIRYHINDVKKWEAKNE